MKKASLFDLLKACLPPVVTGAVEHRFLRVHYTGHYASWQLAMAASDGYDTPMILERVTEATQHVRAGEAAAERDGIALDEPEYPWPVVFGLMTAAMRSGGALHVTDFGGGLGSLYHLLKPLLPEQIAVQWSVIEQAHYVERGQEQFATDQLRFYPDVEACHRERSAQLLLLSSVLAYLPDPYQQLQELLAFRYRYVILDRQQVLEQPDDRLTVQRVPRSFYGQPISYPAWLLSAEKLKATFEQHGYRLLLEQDADIETNSPDIAGHRDVAMIWVLQDEAEANA